MKEVTDKIEKILNERYPSAPTYNYAVAQEIVDTFYSIDGMCCPACNKPFADSDIRSHPAEYHQCKKCGAIQHTACMGNIDWLEGRE